MAWDGVRRYRTGSGQILERIHDPDRCQPGFCVIHRPMHGPWDTWPTYWRTDRQIMERICSHGVGHPVAEDYERLPEYEAVHGCCGCPCTPTSEVSNAA